MYIQGQAYAPKSAAIVPAWNVNKISRTQRIPSAFATDAILARRVLDGDHEAFYQLIRPCERRVYVFALSVLRNHADAEEVSQESMLKAFKNLSRFRGESRFSTWLMRIATNEALIRLRSRRTHGYQSLSALRVGEGDSCLFDDFPDPGEMPSASLERKEFRRALHNALYSLPRNYRDVFVLRDLRNLTTHQTAGALGITKSLVKTRLSRARMKMRRTLRRFGC